MEIKEMIETLRYKANNIKAKIEPEFFNEVAERLEKQVAKDIHIYANGTEHCPSCDANLTGMGFRYCVECGQALEVE
jgi:hypothetical protein